MFWWELCGRGLRLSVFRGCLKVEIHLVFPLACDLRCQVCLSFSDAGFSGRSRPKRKPVRRSLNIARPHLMDTTPTVLPSQREVSTFGFQCG